MNRPKQESPQALPHRAKSHSHAVSLLRFLNQQGLSRRKLKRNKWARFITDRILLRELWIFERDSIARAWLIGALVATSPFFGFHILIDLVLLVIFRANIPLGLALVLLTNPVTIIPFYTFAYFIGSEIVAHQAPHPQNIMDMIHAGIWSVIHSPKIMLKDFLDFFFTLTVGCTAIGVATGLIGYTLIKSLIKKTSAPRS